MDTENSFLSSRVLLTTGIIISTLLLCVVASDFHAFMPAGSPPNQQAFSQRQQNRFAEFYPGRSTGSPTTTVTASAPRFTSTVATAPVISVSQSTAAASENSVTATDEQVYTPDISAPVSGGENPSPGNVTINSDLAPQLASLNARLDELSKQLAEKNSNEPTERVFEYRIEEETTAKSAKTDRNAPEHQVVVASASSVSESVAAVAGPSQHLSPVQPAAPAPQVVPQFAPQPAPISQLAPVPQVIVVTQPVYPWGMPPVATPSVLPTPMSTPALQPSAVSHTPAPRNEPPAENAWENAEHHVHENNGVTNVFPLNLQMSLNIAPSEKTAETGVKITERTEPEFTPDEHQTDSKPVSVHKQRTAQKQEVPQQETPSEDLFEKKIVSDFGPAPKPDVSPAAAEKVPASKPEVFSTDEREAAELFMPFEPIEPEPVPEPVAAPSKSLAPVTMPQPKETAVAIVMNSKPATVTSEDEVPVLEPIIDPSVEPASAKETADSELFIPQPETSEPDATSSPKSVPAPEPDPMFQVPSTNSGLPPQALMTVPASPEPAPAFSDAAPVQASAPPVAPVLVPQPKTEPRSVTPSFDTTFSQSWPSPESVPAGRPMATPRTAPEKAGKRSRFSAVRDAFSEAGEEVRERFDNLPRPSFDVPNWMEKLGSDSEPSSEPMAPRPSQAPVPSNPGASNSAGPRRFHDAQNATGKPGQAMVQGHPSAVARREPNRPVNIPTGSPRPASAPQTVMRTPGAPAYVQTQPNVQPPRVMSFSGPALPRPAMAGPAVPRFDTPDWIEDPPVQWPSPPVSQTAHRLSSALRFAGQPKVVR